MQDSAKYLIHADISAAGVVERSDVVGAIFGQTEGLLGNELDLRDLQESSKVGRIDVSVRSEAGRSFGEVTIASGLDKVETAVLAAALETIERVGPCRADLEVRRIEDVRAAKRREIVDRATELVSEFEEDVMSTEELVEEVRQTVRVDDVTEYEGLPAGPRVADSDAVVVVEGRADVVQLLRYGVKNAVAVEGTDVPDAIARLSEERTVTAFLDGDRGGDLILKELQQVGNLDYVAFAPEGQSVEDLSREAVMSALRQKVPFEAVAEASAPHEQVAATDGSTRPAPPEATDGPTVDQAPASGTEQPGEDGESADDEPDASTDEKPAADGDVSPTDDADQASDTAGEQSSADADPETLAGYVQRVIAASTGEVVLLDEAFERIGDGDADDAATVLVEAEQVPTTVVVDGPVTQRLLDVAAQRGVEQVVGRSEGEFVKQPTSVRVRTAAQFEVDA